MSVLYQRLQKQHLTVYILILVAILAAFVHLLPFLAAQWQTPARYAFTDNLNTSPDAMQYYSWARQTQTEGIVVTNKFTTEPNKPHLVVFFYFLLGQVAAMTGVSPEFVYMYAGGVLAAGLAVLLFLIARQFMPPGRPLWWLFGLLLLGGGLGPLIRILVRYDFIRDNLLFRRTIVEGIWRSIQFESLRGQYIFQTWFDTHFLWLWLVTAVAFACYLPWAMYIQAQPGGYVGLTAYQRTLINRNIFQNIWQHVQFQSYFIGPYSRFSVPLALLLGLVVSRQGGGNRRLWLLLGGVSVVGMVLGNVGTAVLLAVPLVILIWRQPDAYPVWLLLAWLGLWLASTPLYKPYARLILPFVLAVYLAAGFVLQTAVHHFTGPATTPNHRRTAILAGVTAALLMIAFFLPTHINPWQPERSQANTATAVHDYVPSGSRIIVIGEPTLAFYLHLEGYAAFERIEDIAKLAQVTEPVYVMTGVYVDRAPSLRQGLQQLDERLTHLASFAMDPGDIRLLDDARQNIAKQYRENPDDTYNLDLYYLQPESVTNN